MYDRGTGFSLVAPLQSRNLLEVLEALSYHLMRIVGIPEILITENGKEFTLNMFQGFCYEFGIKHKFTCAYHPQANGLVERFYQALKQALRALEYPESWKKHSPFIILVMNNTVACNIHLLLISKHSVKQVTLWGRTR